MLHKYIVGFISLVLSFTIGFGQQQGPNIAFDKMVHDYGKIKEADGLAKYKFEFTNTGSQPLVITNVKPTCGCTSSDYTKYPVKPGEKGFVSAEYNPKNRPGPFNKSIRVMSNSVQNSNISLTIKGNVEPRKRTVADDYPRQMGNLRLDNSQVSFMNIKNNEVQTKSLKIINIGEEPLSLEVDGVRKDVNIEFKPKTLNPGGKGVIEITFDAKASKQIGFIRDRMRLKMNGKTDNKHSLYFSAIVKEDFSHLTPEERANAPHIKFDTTKFDFGTITQGEKVSYKYEFTNTGKSDLYIRRVKASCGCTAVAPPKEAIKPGEKSFISTTFNSRGKQNRQHKTITVYVNDPDNSVIKLSITGTVKKK